MKLEVLDSAPDYIHLSLAGRLDIAAASVVEKDLLSAISDGERSAIVDFSGVTFIGSMGLRVLLVAVKDLRGKHRKLIVLNPSRIVADVFDASGILDVLEVAPDFEKAVALACAGRSMT